MDQNSKQPPTIDYRGNDPRVLHRRYSDRRVSKFAVAVLFYGMFSCPCISGAIMHLAWKHHVIPDAIEFSMHPLVTLAALGLLFGIAAMCRVGFSRYVRGIEYALAGLTLDII